MIRKILVPFDGSEKGEKGLVYACWLANKVEAEITVLYVVNIPYTGESAVLNIDHLISAGRGFLEKAKKIALRENCINAHYKWIHGTGNSGHEIVKLSLEENFSLIVMSARGHTPLTHLLLGSVSDMVVHHAPCPVLIVR